ncbi:conserved hypothetical protein [methanotrophic bacterial endosymbiont of Bathymodiolus sp.]|nr:conserved hypothetical protein [methanotrophic bacterial endosymbiont of Bathymodiolus sp.]
MGVFLYPDKFSLPTLRLPHARGGVSRCEVDLCCTLPSSPRPWGCFCYRIRGKEQRTVFPTPVGVFLIGEVAWMA